MYRHVLRIGSPSLKQLCPSFRRLIFTDEYLDLDKFQEARNRDREELTTAQLQYKPSALKSRIQASADKGLLLSEDLIKISCMVDTEKDLEDFKKLLERYVELNKTNAIVLTNAGRNMSVFYKLCRVLRLPDLALDMFNNPVVEPRYVHGAGLYTHLLDLLYKEEKHKEVFEVFNQIMIDLDDLQSTATRDIMTLVLLSIYKSGEEDSFAKATSVINSLYSNSKSDFKDAWGRGTYAYALLAIKAGEYSLAYEAVQNNNANIYRNNIELDTLAKMGRLSSAINLLDKLTMEVDAPARMLNRKPIFLASVVDSLVAAVKEANDPKITEKVRVTFKRLDNTADIVDEDMDKFMFAPIRSSKSSRKVEDEGNGRSARDDRSKDYNRTRPRNKETTDHHSVLPSVKRPMEKKKKKKNPSRIRKDAKRLEAFLAKKTDSTSTSSVCNPVKDALSSSDCTSAPPPATPRRTATPKRPRKLDSSSRSTGDDVIGGTGNSPIPQLKKKETRSLKGWPEICFK